MVSLSLVAQQPDRYIGTSLVVPFLALSEKDSALFDKLKPAAKFINYIAPTFKFDVRKGRKLEKWILNWADDPLYTGTKICASNLTKSD